MVVRGAPRAATRHSAFRNCNLPPEVLMKLTREVGLAVVAALCSACSAGDPVTPAVMPVSVRARAALVPLDPFGIGVSVAGSPGCTALAHRQFDFWVGKWD